MIPYSPFRYIDLGLFKIYMWGLMVSIAVLVSTFLAAKEAKKKKINPDNIYNIVAYILIGLIIGGRLTYVFAHLKDFTNIIDILKIWEGGLIFYGGLLGALIAAFVYLKKNKLNFWKYADILAPYTALGIAIGRIGCFLNGCCYGLKTSMPWAIYHLGELRHPTQIYSSINALIIFFILKKIKKRFDGQIFLLFLLIYSTTRFIIEFFRYYEFRIYNLTGSQIISIIVFILALFLYKRKS